MLNQRLLDLTRDLMRHQTVNGNDQEFEEAFGRIEEYFSDTELEKFEHEEDGVRSIVFATEGDPEIMLHGHVDVVGADEELFDPRIEDGRLYGRGAADMKSGLACLMEVMRTVDKDVSVGLMVVSDEESADSKAPDT